MGFSENSWNKAKVQPDSEKVSAIHEAPEPKNKTELLLKGNTTWNFGPTEREAFTNCKTLLQATSVLAHYDENKPLVLTCDASPYGLGVVLAVEEIMGRNSSLAFASRTLSDTERNYDQFDKEGLALLYGCKPVPSTLSPRMIRGRLLLSSFSYTLKYWPGEQLGNVDALSRLPLPNMVECPPHTVDVLFLESEDSPHYAIQIAAVTQADSSLWMVKTWIENGRVNLKDCQTFASVVIPQHLQQPILEELRAHHPGIVAMKELAKCYFWWPGLGEDIERGMAERGVQIAKNALRWLSGQNVDCELSIYMLIQKNTPRLSTGKSLAELLVGRCLRKVFYNMLPNHQTCKLQQMSPFRKFHSAQCMWERRLTGDKWKPAEVLTTEGPMCYKILQKNGAVPMRHVYQPHDWGKDDGKLDPPGQFDPPPHRLLPPLHQRLMLRTRIRSLFLGSRRNSVSTTHLWMSSRREPQNESYLNQSQKSCLLLVLCLRSCDIPNKHEQGPTADIITLYTFSINMCMYCS
ncbi:hypothetical protein PR048_006686 [Dryococelus australis]|uniref:RNA-directed DNA polymerase n=1 Tax=Dryococelus australis TaxID=614101 RepID=A0ABQ9IBQ4_9NEOP|nr:hypothetical protein PR048_006686 [Dryococelus australis]